MIAIIEVTDPDGHVAQPDWLARAEGVHRELRQFTDSYTTTMARVFAGGGRMRIAVVDDAVASVAVYRVYDKTHPGLQMYVDDLVTAATQRSSGVGRALLTSLEETARELGCVLLELDSGTARVRAHAFYLRERMQITAFHFTKPLGEVPPLIL